MRSAMARAGRDPAGVDPLVPADLVIDHSVQVDAFGTRFAYARNIEREYERNGERYALLRWAQGAFEGFRVVPPGMGIVHQVNLEHLGRVVQVRDGVALPDTLVGTDSHTTMIDALGILGWGVGGIEAEAVMLGEPLVLPTPIVVGVEFRGALRTGVTATDLVLTLTEMLRRHGVVGKFVEFCGDGLSALSIPDRATLSNMAPEYGATAATFPVDAETLSYLRQTARGDACELVEAYCRAQGLWRTDGDPTPTFTELLVLDLDDVEPSLAGPRRPQDRVALAAAPASFSDAFPREPNPVRVAGSAMIPADADLLHRGARGRRRDRPRRRRDRRDHVVHQHLEPVRDGRRRPARPEGGRARPGVEAVGEDQPRARLARRHRLPGARRPAPRRSTRCASTSSATAARPASATPARCPTRSPRRSPSTTSRSCRCSPATATSRAASTRRCARATSPLPRSWSPTRWPAPSRSTWSTSRSAPAPTASRSTCATSGRPPRRCAT